MNWRGAWKDTLVLDEDDMASDSDQVLATQQSIKAYVDAVAAAIDLSKILAGDSYAQIVDTGTGQLDIVIDGDVIGRFNTGDGAPPWNILELGKNQVFIVEQDTAGDWRIYSPGSFAFRIGDPDTFDQPFYFDDASMIISANVTFGTDASFNLTENQASDLTACGIGSFVQVDSNATGIAAALYMAADGHYDEADADSAGTMPVRVLALQTGTGSNKKVMHMGYIRNDAWSWTPGADIFASTTTGGLTQTAPSGSGDQVQKVGYAISATEMFFNPSNEIIQVA